MIRARPNIFILVHAQHSKTTPGAVPNFYEGFRIIEDDKEALFGQVLYEIGEYVFVYGNGDEQ